MKAIVQSRRGLPTDIHVIKIYDATVVTTNVGQQVAGRVPVPALRGWRLAAGRRPVPLLRLRRAHLGHGGHDLRQDKDAVDGVVSRLLAVQHEQGRRLRPEPTKDT
jgi:hypothetical protein